MSNHPSEGERARERLLASPSPFPLAAAAVCIGTTGAAVRPDGGGINNGVLCLVSERFGPQASDMLVPVGNSASSLEGWKDDYSANDTGSSKKILLSFVTHVPSGWMGFALAV